MAQKNLVIVESPAKARTIEKYLGPGYKVLASYGHVRDLVVKDGSVRPEENFAMSWQISDRAKKNIAAIEQALGPDTNLILATDPDREGEAIAWHICEVFGKRIKQRETARIVFHEITKKSVTAAMERPRTLNMDLVSAYLARRCLDYLVGFSISPILWRKLPQAKSAGRVQSVALRLVCEREAEIEAFKPKEYWSVEAGFKTKAGETFPARLTLFEGDKIAKFSFEKEAQAEKARKKIEQGQWSVAEIKPTTAERRPVPPFTTSTLQQEASRKLGFGATKTMKTAQQLYEGIKLESEATGLITYMRTDSVSIGKEAIEEARKVIATVFGPEFLPQQPNSYKTKSRNAQEAHEAIRPTDFARKPETLKALLDAEQFKLYDMIWKRALASQMSNAMLDKMAVDIADGSGQTMLRANGSIIRFEGFLKVYKEGVEDQPEEDEDRTLPLLKKAEKLILTEALKEQHFTQPPPRYSEASLVKKLEELGIGRPSTYASILRVLKDRRYVTLDKKRFIPEESGWLVTAFLCHFFASYVEYDFTAALEEKLDHISHGDVGWQDVLGEFWQDFDKTVKEVMEIQPSKVRETLDADLESHYFPETAEGGGEKARECQACNKGRLELKTGRYGVFIGCSEYPECRYTRQISHSDDEKMDEDIEANQAIDRLVGKLPEGEVYVKKGPYGFYVQLGETPEKGSKKKKPKRTSIPKIFAPNTLTLDEAEKLLALPREIGLHPETKKPIIAQIGPYGPYLRHDGRYTSLPDVTDALDIQINRAVQVIAEGGSTQSNGQTIGDHPDGNGAILLKKGRFGPYVSHNKINASIPRAMQGHDLTVEEAVMLIERKKEAPAKEPKPGKKKTAKKPAKKPAPKTAKKTAKTAKKAAPKRKAKKAQSA